MVAVDVAAWVEARPPESAKSLRAWSERGPTQRRRLNLGGGASGSEGADDR